MQLSYFICHPIYWAPSVFICFPISLSVTHLGLPLPLHWNCFGWVYQRCLWIIYLQCFSVINWPSLSSLLLAALPNLEHLPPNISSILNGVYSSHFSLGLSYFLHRWLSLHLPSFCFGFSSVLFDFLSLYPEGSHPTHSAWIISKCKWSWYSAQSVRPGGSRVIKAHSLDNYPSFMHGNLPSSDAALLYKCLIKDLCLPKKSKEGLWKSWHLLYPRLTFFSLLPEILFITPREWVCNSLCVLQSLFAFLVQMDGVWQAKGVKLFSFFL